MQQARTVKLSFLLAVMVTLLVVLVLAVRDDRQLRISTQATDLSETNLADGATSATAVLQQPRYSGENIAGDTWHMQAEEAVQIGNVNETVLNLRHVEAVWYGDLPLEIKAGRGVYKQEERLVELTDKVVVEGADLQMTMSAAEVNLVSYTVVSKQGIVKLTGQVAEGSRLWLTAPQFELSQRGRLLVWSGGVKGRWQP